MSSHAEEELWVDNLERLDIEHAILKGRIEKKMTRDIRGTRYRIEGPTRDLRWMDVVCRFDGKGELLIITVYTLGREE